MRLYCLIVLAPALFLRDGGAADGDPLTRRDPIAARSEIDAAAAWAREHLLGPVTAAPFTFIYDGRPSSEFLGSWERAESARDLDARRKEQ